MSAPSFAAMETMPDAVIVLGRDGSIVYSNALADRFFGYETGKLTHLKIDSLIPEKHRKRASKLLQESLCRRRRSASVSTDAELRVVRSDGRELPVEIALGPAEGGTHVVAVVREVSEAVSMRDELRESEERFRLAASHTADTLQYINLRKDLYTWHTDVDRLMGYEPDEFPRTVTGWLKLIHPDDVNRVEATMERIIENGEKTWNFRYRIRARDGSYRHWLDRGTVTGFIDGRPNEGIGAIVDETQQVLGRQKLEETLLEVEQLKDCLQAESQYLREEIKSVHDFEEIIGSSAPMMATLHKVEQVAATDASVLLLGETGTGKELLARAIHSRSKRNQRPLIKVDCTTIPPGLFESELFGHEKGAFTGAHRSKPGRFELADGGTVFLDEIGELPLELQPKLLRAIQQGDFERLGAKRKKHVDVRVIAATNRDLQEEMRAGRFRSDLYYRIGVFPIEVPPLRDRREDLPLLVSFFVSQWSKKLGAKVDRVPTAVKDALKVHDWPGNVRELQSFVQRALILSPRRELVLTEPLALPRARPRAAEGSLTQGLKEVERTQILDALEASRWKIKGDGNAASRLGLKPSTLRSRMKSLGIERPASKRERGVPGVLPVNHHKQ